MVLQLAKIPTIYRDWQRCVKLEKGLSFELHRREGGGKSIQWTHMTGGLYLLVIHLHANKTLTIFHENCVIISQLSALSIQFNHEFKFSFPPKRKYNFLRNLNIFE